MVEPAAIVMLSPVRAAQVLHRGGVIAYPTEAVWGLGCDPADEATVQRLLDIKQRPREKGLILIAATLEQLRPWVDLSALPADRLAEVLASWPGPYTWVLPASAQAPAWITGKHDGIAVRVSAHADVAALCEAFGRALVSTSANLAGQPPARSRDELDPALLARIEGVCIGTVGDLARPTSIRDAISGQPLRD
ncbi:Sua5/YciO/YrdC/YwlC family protein [Pseudoxanthomonas mexicana]|uniref:Sua5/YciO/YrdC/YwlC family protein n=1 Tax=Pseudoxanthomonas mexicana TaxID=128785 RepID=UPI00398B190E